MKMFPMRLCIFVLQLQSSIIRTARSFALLQSVKSVQLCRAIPEEMDKPLSKEDFAAMEDQLKDCVEEDRKYWRVNDVKCNAIYTARTYEEFADRVAAAHLQPLEKKDYKNKSVRSWNQYATKEKDCDE